MVFISLLQFSHVILLVILNVNLETGFHISYTSIASFFKAKFLNM